MLFGGYRRGDANDPDMYVASIAAVLATYDPEIIARVTDPRTGISTHEKFRSFMPNSGELKAYCDEQQAILDRHRRYAALPAPEFKQPRPPQHRANVFVPSYAPQYTAMIERAKTGDPREWRYDETRPGIWVALGWIKPSWAGIATIASEIAERVAPAPAPPWDGRITPQLEAVVHEQNARLASIPPREDAAE